jgi:hypothetical protein
MMGLGGPPPLPSARSGFDRFPKRKTGYGAQHPGSLPVGYRNWRHVFGIPDKRDAFLPSVPEETAK